MDNLNIKGIREDDYRRRGNRKKGRKRFSIQSRHRPGPTYRPTGLGFLWRRFENWSTHSRYHTASARDTAYAALVKKAAVSHMRSWVRIEYRKGSP
jgi:hypothetical protein